MQLNSSISIVDRANAIVSKVGSREPEDIAERLGIKIMPVHFTRQKGVYKVIERNRFIFIKDDLCPEMRKIVLLHEIGHDVLHRGEAKTFQEFNIFDMKDDRMESRQTVLQQRWRCRMKKSLSLSTGGATLK